MLTAESELSREKVMRWADDLYANAVDEKDAAGFAGAFAPDGWVQFGNWPRTQGREAITAADGILFVSPEYNRGVPSALKNAIDVGSRPYGKSVWSRKPAAIVTASPGAIGGFGANHHLRQSLVFLDMPILQQPEAYVGGAGALFDDRGELTQESTRALFASFIERFAAWVERHSPAQENGHA